MSNLVLVGPLLFICVHLGSPWVTLGSLGFTWIHLSLLEFTLAHMGSLWFTWVDLGSFQMFMVIELYWRVIGATREKNLTDSEDFWIVQVSMGSNNA